MFSGNRCRGSVRSFGSYRIKLNYSVFLLRVLMTYEPWGCSVYFNLNRTVLVFFMCNVTLRLLRQAGQLDEVKV